MDRKMRCPVCHNNDLIPTLGDKDRLSLVCNNCFTYINLKRRYYVPQPNSNTGGWFGCRVGCSYFKSDKI